MDIDFDVKRDGFNVKKIFPEATQASMVDGNNNLKKHNVGWYFQTMPTDPVTNLSAIPYKQAEDFGFFKIDFLHINVYEHFESKEEIRELLKIEPNWDLLLFEKNYENLFQISRHFNVVSKIQPRNIPELADCIAIIRPGGRSLLDTYISSNVVDRIKIRPLLYEAKENDAYTFKKSHAHAYALTILLQLHLLEM